MSAVCDVSLVLQCLRIVVEVGFLLCLHLHDALHKVLVIDLQPVPVNVTVLQT